MDKKQDNDGRCRYVPTSKVNIKFRITFKMIQPQDQKFGSIKIKITVFEILSL